MSASRLSTTVSDAREDAVVSQLNAPVRLNRPGYWCNPSIAAVTAMDKKQRQAVEDLTVGRQGYGSVKFFGPTDVNSQFVQNLDQIVTIEDMSVEVYPPGWSPINGPGDVVPVGTGLNKRALVTLERCWPKDKSSGAPVMDPAKLEKFAARLKIKTEELGARFVQYDTKTGTWQFEVDHFSRYGLSSEDLDDEDDAMPDAQQQPQQQQQAMGVTSTGFPFQSNGV
jgi:nuclear pore complex protein Nup98-Nup96